MTSIKKLKTKSLVGKIKKGEVYRFMGILKEKGIVRTKIIAILSQKGGGESLPSPVL